MWKKTAFVVVIVILLLCLWLLVREERQVDRLTHRDRMLMQAGFLPADFSWLKRMLMKLHHTNKEMMCSRSYVTLVDNIIDRLKDQVCILKLRELKQEVEGAVPDKKKVIQCIIKYLDYLEKYCDRFPHKKQLVSSELDKVFRVWLAKSSHNTSVCATNMEEALTGDNLAHERKEVYESSFMENIVNS